MAGWTDIFDDVDGPPVRGEVAEFARVREHFGRMEDDGRTIVTEFARFRGDGQANGSLEGDAADAFARFVEDVGDSLDDLPRVAGEAHDVFAEHVRQLEGMVEAADRALARARTAWDHKQDLEASAERLRDQVAALRQRAEAAQQTADSSPEPDPAAQSAADDVSRQAGAAAGSLGNVEDGIAEQEGILRQIRGEWSDLRDGENRRNEATIDGLDGIDLGDLKDPGLFGKIVGAVAGFVGAVVDVALGPLDEILVALVKGDWATLLWELKELLDSVLLVAAVVALLFPLTAPFALAIFALSVAALALNAGLYLSQTPNPQTGQTVRLRDVLFSAAGVVLGVAGARSALTMASKGTGSFVPRSGLESLAKTGKDVRSVITRGDDAAAAAQSLGVRILPFSDDTPMLMRPLHVIRAPGGAMATARLVNSLNGAMPGSWNIIPGMNTTSQRASDAVTTGSGADGLRVDVGSPNPNVFTRIAHRQRFDPPTHWNHPAFPGGQQLQIIPVR